MPRVSDASYQTDKLEMGPVLAWCWVNVCDGGQTLSQHGFNLFRLLGTNLQRAATL